jgi:hypothetical protein
LLARFEVEKQTPTIAFERLPRSPRSLDRLDPPAGFESRPQTSRQVRVVEKMLDEATEAQRGFRNVAVGSHGKIQAVNLPG